MYISTPFCLRANKKNIELKHDDNSAEPNIQSRLFCTYKKTPNFKSKPVYEVVAATVLSDTNHHKIIFSPSFKFLRITDKDQVCPVTLYLSQLSSYSLNIMNLLNNSPHRRLLSTVTN